MKTKEYKHLEKHFQIGREVSKDEFLKFKKPEKQVFCIEKDCKIAVYVDRYGIDLVTAHRLVDENGREITVHEVSDDYYFIEKKYLTEDEE